MKLCSWTPVWLQDATRAFGDAVRGGQEEGSGLGSAEEEDRARAAAAAAEEAAVQEQLRRWDTKLQERERQGQREDT